MANVNQELTMPSLKDIELSGIDLNKSDNELSNGLQHLKNVFRKMDLRPNNKMPEKTFVEYILPIIAGEKVFDTGYEVDGIDNNRSGVTIAEYIALAGSTYSEIDVVSNDYSSVLFTLPPMFCRDVVVNKHSDRNISSDFKLAKLKATDYKMESEAIVMNTLFDRIALIPLSGENKIVRSYMERWNDILLKYGKEPMASLKDNAVATLPNQNDVSLDFD